MKKNLSYRDKLLELSKIYNISEIKNYIKRKNFLTTSQIELILKNKVPIPKDINVSFFDKTFSRPISKAGKKVDDVYSKTTGTVADGFVGFWKMLGHAGIECFKYF